MWHIFVILATLLCLSNARLPKQQKQEVVVNKPELGFFWDTLRIGSWNIMGMPWLPFRQQAIDLLFAKDRQSFDVLHLIEVWDPTDQANIIDRAKKIGFKYSYVPPVRNGPSGCDFSDPTSNVTLMSQYFIHCLVNQQYPGPINTQTLVQPYPYPMNESCGMAAIGLSFEVLSGGQQCLACLMNAMQDLPNGVDAFGALSVCGSQQGKKYFNGGQNGQMILSKYPITDVTETHLEAFLSNRVNIYATINNIRIGFGHFAFNVLADYGPFGQYQYGATQVDHARDMIENGPDVIIGDFNTGLDYQPDGYNLLLENGFVDAIQPQPVQTWCPPQSLNFQLCINSGSYSASIDHIMIKNSCRLWSRKSSLFNNQGTTVSDHIGVATTVSKLWFKNENLREKFQCFD